MGYSMQTRNSGVTVKPVFSGHSKIKMLFTLVHHTYFGSKTEILVFRKTNGSLIKVASIAECSLGSILQYFGPALRDNRS